MLIFRKINLKNLFLYIYILLLLFFGIQSIYYVYIEKYHNYPITVITREFGYYDKNTGNRFLYGGYNEANNFYKAITNNDKQWEEIITINGKKKILNNDIVVELKNIDNNVFIIISSKKMHYIPYNTNQIIKFYPIKSKLDNI